MNKVKKLIMIMDALKEASRNNYKSWCSISIPNPIKRRKEYRNVCYNFEYKFGSNISHCAKKSVCDEDCEYMRNFKE